MKREDLKKLGIEDEVIDKIMAMNGQDIESHKTKLTTAQTELKASQDQLKEANQQIEKFKGMDVESIQKAADEWKTKAEKAEQAASEQITKLKFDHALESALSDAKAKNPKAVKALLNTEGLKLNEDGSILGLKEQLETITKENDYLFESENPTPKIVTVGNNKTVVGDAVVNAAREAAGLPPLEEK
jgi:predicted  nucleic acid-binding Zn-ribbon protein